jgi:hypothetical protein
MNNENREPDDENAARIAAPLRGPEKLSDGFEARLMSEVRRELVSGQHAMSDGHVSVIRRSWWTAPRSLSVSPLASLMIAVGFAALIAVSTLAFGRPRAQTTQPIAERSVDTVHIVRFVFLDSTAKRIAVVVDSNGGTPNATPLMARDGTGMWTASVALRPGQHEYAFIIDGKRWAPDPYALTTTDEFGTKSSRMTVGSSDVVTTE